MTEISKDDREFYAAYAKVNSGHYPYDHPTPETGTTARIRWSAGAKKWLTAWFGSVGTVDPHLFSILRPMAPDDEWALTSDLPGFVGRASYGGGPEPLKAEAERWLEEFISSLGAVWPETPKDAEP